MEIDGINDGMNFIDYYIKIKARDSSQEIIPEFSKKHFYGRKVKESKLKYYTFNGLRFQMVIPHLPTKKNWEKYKDRNINNLKKSKIKISLGSKTFFWLVTEIVTAPIEISKVNTIENAKLYSENKRLYDEIESLKIASNFSIMETPEKMNKRIIEESQYIINDVNINIHWRALKSYHEANQILLDNNLPNLRFIEHINAADKLFPKFDSAIIGYLYDINGEYNTIELYYGSDKGYDSPHKKKHFNVHDSENLVQYSDIDINDNLEKAIKQIRSLFYDRGFEHKDYQRYSMASSQLRKRGKYCNDKGILDRESLIMKMFNSFSDDDRLGQYKFVFNDDSNSEIYGFITFNEENIVRFNQVLTPNYDISFQILDSNYKIDLDLKVYIDYVLEILNVK